MRKSGLTSGTIQRLCELSTKRPSKLKKGSWEDESEGASIEDGLDSTSDDALTSPSKDTEEFIMGNESTEEVTEDSREDYSVGMAEEVNRKDDPVLEDMNAEPWDDAWEFTANKLAYDIRNYYQEGGSEPVEGPVSIHVGIIMESWENVEDSDLNSFETYIRDRLKSELKLTNQHQLLVEVRMNTPDAGLIEGGVEVVTDFDGVEPSDALELETLIDGLVMSAVMEYQG